MTRLWLADITYVPTDEGYLFLGVVMDMYSPKIVGWSMRDNLEAELVVDALAMAVTRRRPPAGLIQDLEAGVDPQLRVLGHLGALVPGEGAAQLLGERRDRGDDRVADGFGAVAGERRPVLFARLVGGLACAAGRGAS